MKSKIEKIENEYKLTMIFNKEDFTCDSVDEIVYDFISANVLSLITKYENDFNDPTPNP